MHPPARDREVIPLPPPRLSGDFSLNAALAGRRSVREFTSRDLEPEEISQLLWAAQGITGAEGERTAPSAGALFPLEIFLGRSGGLFRYLPRQHALERWSDRDPRPAFFRAALRQEPVRSAPAVFLIAAVIARVSKTYGQDAVRYVDNEVGHAAQNLLLQAVALGLGGVPIGAFHSGQISAALLLPADHEPLYLVPVGEARL